MLEIVWRNPNKLTTTSRSGAKDGTDLIRRGLTLLKFDDVDNKNSLFAANAMDLLPAAGALDHVRS